MNYIESAELSLDRSENANAHDNAVLYAQQATACALIAIAQELRRMNDRVDRRITEQKQRETELPF